MSEGVVPVFVFPPTLSFFVNDQTSHKQVLTLYNPYEYGVRFQVLCSSRDNSKYSVVDPEGSIKPQCCVDIVIRHNNVTAQNVGQHDKFRIQMFHIGSKKLIGKKDVRAEVFLSDGDRQTPDRELFSIPTPAISHPPQQYQLGRRNGRQGTPSGLVICVALLCSVGLLLPSSGEASTFIPEYLKPSVNMKLVMAYVLGLVTMVLLRLT